MATNHFGMDIKNYIRGINWKCRHVLRFSIGEKIKYNITGKKYMSDAYRIVLFVQFLFHIKWLKSSKHNARKRYG